MTIVKNFHSWRVGTGSACRAIATITLDYNGANGNSLTLDNFAVRNQSPGPDGEGSGTGTVVTSAVSEPATWAMMRLGFGLVGGALRRRNSVVSDAPVRFA